MCADNKHKVYINGLILGTNKTHGLKKSEIWRPYTIKYVQSIWKGKVWKILQ